MKLRGAHRDCARRQLLLRVLCHMGSRSPVRKLQSSSANCRVGLCVPRRVCHSEHQQGLIPKFRRPLRQCPVVTDNRSEMERTLNQLSKRYDFSAAPGGTLRVRLRQPMSRLSAKSMPPFTEYATVDNGIGMLSSASFRRAAEIKRGGGQHCQHSPYMSLLLHGVSATCTTV
jgi:hypothetical protein